MPKRPLSQPDVNMVTKWTVCSPETAGNFTACGYFMARELRKELNVPIGLINTSWGGTRIEPWTTPGGFKQVPTLTDISKMVAAADPNSDANKDNLTNLASLQLRIAIRP